MKFQVVFTVKNVLRVFTEVVEANDTEHAKKVVQQLCKDHNLQLVHVTAIIQL